MPAWLFPALRAILPHVGTIVSAASPVFTKKSAEATANQATALQEQINELQAAASANDAHIKALAAQLQETLQAIEASAALAAKRSRSTLTIAVGAAIVALIALAVAIFAALSQ
jgi:tetrahydromethanopterin S-methyltransferase subunit B